MSATISISHEARQVDTTGGGSNTPLVEQAFLLAALLPCVPTRMSATISISHEARQVGTTGVHLQIFLPAASALVE
jgi:hypothetical protein